MAKTTYEEANTFNTRTSNQVGIFSLKEDGDEAIVRFLDDKVEDLEIFTIHDGKFNGKYRRVSCMRTSANDPISKCPMCDAGRDLKRRVFIHLLQYTTDANGNIVAEPKVWDRGVDFVAKIRNYMEEYAPLSNNIFKVRRNGAAGETKTTYDIMLASPSIYTEANYPKEEDAFVGYEVLGHLVLDKTEDDMNYYLKYGSFPSDDSDTESSSSESRLERPARY